MSKCFFYVIILCVFVPAVACEKVTAGNVKNKEKWDALNFSSYIYTIKKSCFCSPEYMKMTQVSVVNGEVVSALYLNSDEKVPDKVIDSFLTISEWFDKISSVANNENSTIDVQYDNKLGYPVSIKIDMHKRRADDEMSVFFYDVVKR
ncbi:MAG: DUF6174 domain-containing protein [Gammaproteobacteria bacterium]|nr:DUF6174 domain-containing protein [Gammaproteobacteria bacterium]